MTNQLLTSKFLHDSCLTAPLPDDWSYLPAPALTKRRWLWLGLALLPAIILLVLVLLSPQEPGLYAVLAVVLLLGVALQLWLPLQVDRTRFLLRQQDFLFESGVWWRRAVLVPLTRVQHVTVSQGPLQKQFGLATLSVFTAGGEHAEASLADIDYQLAQTLCSQLSQLIPTEAGVDVR
jgi:membrane protein YdbS with pleckstrin-like domain